MLALTIRFCACRQVPSRPDVACGRRFQPAERVPNRPPTRPQVEAAIADSSRSSSGRPFAPSALNRRHPEAKNAERAVDAQSF